MQYTFHAYGHPDILGTHKTTLEFTKEKEVTLNGNCIIGVCADFDFDKLTEFIKKARSTKITINVHTRDKKIKEMINAELNLDFSHNEEIVIRKTNFISQRTLAIKANKAAFDLNRQLIEFLKEKQNVIGVVMVSERQFE
ncbi:DUF371 domain-containing protein [Candidatus Woesearchaeota archaeon]|nr:DUF371 domain-containing protein [Candidatus Woesearchaeota archaeon]